MPPPITSDKEFEKSFASLASARIADRAPALVDQFVGFQILDCSEDQTMATGIYAAKLGDEWVYLPIFYRRGDLKGTELMYLVESDMFVPCSEDWIYYLTGKKRFSLGGRSDRKLGDVTRYDSVDLFNMKRSPLYAKQASVKEFDAPGTPADFHARIGEKVANVWFSNNIQPWAVGAHALDFTADDVMGRNTKVATLVEMLNKAGPARARTALASFNAEPKVAAALAHFYPESELAMIDTWSDRLTAGARLDKWASAKAENEKVLVLKRKGLDRLPDSISMSADEKRKFMQGEIVVKDQRDNTSTVVAKAPDMHTDGPGELGVQDVIMADGTIARCVALAEVVDNQCMPMPCGIGMASMHSPHAKLEAPRLLIFIDKQKGYIRTEDPYAAVEHYNEWYTFGDRNKVFTSTDGLKVDGVYAMAMDDRRTLGVFKVLKIREEKTARIVSARRVSSWSGEICDYKGDDEKRSDITFYLTDDGPKAINENKNQNTFNSHQTVVLNRYACRWVEVEKTDEEKSENVTRTCFGNKLGVLDSRNLNEVIFNGLGADIVRLQATGNEYSVADGELKTASLSRLQALSYLTKVAGIHADTAEAMLKQAEAGSEMQSRATFYVKRAEAYTWAKQADIQQLIQDTITAPSTHIEGQQRSVDSATGLPTVQEGHMDVDVPSARVSPMGDPNEVYNQDPKKLSPTQVDAATTAQQTDQRELFDASALNYLVDADDLDQEIDGMVGDMILGMDKVGRTYFLFLQHTDDFKEIYGDDRLQQFETQLRQTFEKLGDTIMALKRKWGSRQRSQGMAATEVG